MQFEDITKEFFERLYDYFYEELDTENNTFASIIAKFKSFLEWVNEKEYYSGFKHKKYSFTEKEKNVNGRLLLQLVL